MLSPDDKRIKSRSYYSGSDIIRDIKRINKTESLSDELSIFRLASVHKGLNLDSAYSGNVGLVNLRIKFLTKADKEIEYVIPIIVTKDENEILASYSRASVDEAEFLKFYQLVMPNVKAIDPINHFHAEPFLVYYLCSKAGKEFLVREFEKKGLIVVGEGNKHYKSYIKKVISIGIDLHSTKVICFNCTPFLKAAVPHILKSIYWALVLAQSPQDQKLTTIKFNISATRNFTWANISNVSTFDHIPILENEDDSILFNTEQILKSKKVILQRVGEAANRTYFLSGSNCLNDSVTVLRMLDAQKWGIITNLAAIQIQKAWKLFKNKQEQLKLKLSKLQDIEDELADKKKELEQLKRELDTAISRLEVIDEIDDLIEKIEQSKIDGEDEYNEVKDLYQRAIKEGGFEGSPQSGYDHNSKFEYLLEIKDSRDQYKKKPLKEALLEKESEIEELHKRKKELEREIKNSRLDTKARKKTSSTSFSTQESKKTTVNAQSSFDYFNYVGNDTNLTHQNVLHLVQNAYEHANLDGGETAIAVISEDEALDYSLRDAILNFIGQEPQRDRISIALCRGYINRSGQIEGNTHWTALHLRIITGTNGKAVLHGFYMDSMGDVVPSAVSRVMDSIQGTTLEDLGAELANSVPFQRAITRLQNITFAVVQPKKCTTQSDGYSCGYHTVYNMMRMHVAVDFDATPNTVSQNNLMVGNEQFIKDRKLDLQRHFSTKRPPTLKLRSSVIDVDLTMALVESIFIGDDTVFLKIKQLVELEKEIRRTGENGSSQQEAASVLSKLNLEQYYKKLLSEIVVHIRYQHTMDKDYGKDNISKRETIFARLCSSKTAQNPREYIEILEQIIAEPALLSLNLDYLLKELDELEIKEQKSELLIESMAAASLDDKSSVVEAKSLTLESKGVLTSPLSQLIPVLSPPLLSKNTSTTTMQHTATDTTLKITHTEASSIEIEKVLTDKGQATKIQQQLNSSNTQKK